MLVNVDDARVVLGGYRDGPDKLKRVLKNLKREEFFFKMG